MLVASRVEDGAVFLQGSIIMSSNYKSLKARFTSIRIRVSLALKAKSPYDQMWKALLAHLQLIIHKYAKPLVYHLSEPDCLTELSSLINNLLNILKQL